MSVPEDQSFLKRIRQAVLGRARSPLDHSVFHKLSLVAFFAWVGLGADGLSSSCYGPPEAYLALGGNNHLGLFVGLATAVTVLIISASYSQILEAFPSGGGGYLVASKLISPTVGMISGCALLIDYVLTIAVSVASGADAIFSFLPAGMFEYKLAFAAAGVLGLTVLNMRGVKESVLPLVPIFLVFVITHAFIIVYAVVIHLGDVGPMVRDTYHQTGELVSQFGALAVMIMVLKAYSMGAGTFTGIEAVSNGLPMLREPRVQTGKHTMTYMAVSLAFMALGLMVAFVLVRVSLQGRPTQTVNAALFEMVTAHWGGWGTGFTLTALVSEAAILFVGAQTGFMGGPQVLSYMALDRWFPTRFAVLSDRLVTQNGILMMGGAALITMMVTHGDVRVLVVLYSINVFITFVASQLGMVRHWWAERKTVANWRRRISINGLGLVLCCFILVSVSVLKFHQGGWVTFVVTGSLVVLAFAIKAHYNRTNRLLRRLDELVAVADSPAGGTPGVDEAKVQYDPKGQTAVILVSGFNGMGLHTTMGVIRLFRDTFKNFAFVYIGVVDAGNFKGQEAIQRLKDHVPQELERYIRFMRRNGYYAEGFSAIGVDIPGEVAGLVPRIRERFSNPIFFGGQLVFPNETILTRLLHNYLAFALQRKFYHRGIPFVILPIRVEVEKTPARNGKDD